MRIAEFEEKRLRDFPFSVTDDRNAHDVLRFTGCEDQRRRNWEIIFAGSRRSVRGRKIHTHFLLVH